MKNFIYIFLLLFSIAVLADEGDTTFVQAHNYVDLDWNGNYDAWGVFPSGETSYRKILMHYDMRCSSSGCSGWDYTTKIIILKESDELNDNGDPIYVNSQTLANVVTPYGTYMQGNGSEGFSSNWVQRYTYDVTDFAHLLVDSVKMRAFYGGWSTGFNVTLNFEFIEGTPPRNVIDIQNLWSGSNAYADMNDLLHDSLVFIPDSAKNSMMRVTISGHGQDGEFTSGVNYHIKLDDESLYTQEIWRDDCGENYLYPQGGTWIYDRANWCPGDKATTREHELTSYLQTGQDNLLDFDINKNNWNPSEATYIYDAQLITFQEPNFNLDVALEDIVSPSNKQEYFRFNPTCSNPIVKIKNQGIQDLSSVYIYYGFDGYDSNIFLWEGNLAFGQSEIVELPPINWYSWEEELDFYARVSMPNYEYDDYIVNDILYSNYEFVEEYPSSFAMWFKTNSVPNESSYELRDVQGNLIFSRSDMSANTIYKDTFNLQPGCYKFQILDTGGSQYNNEDGLSWWANDDGSGYARLRQVPGGFFKYYQDDFGTELTDYFRVGVPNNINLNFNFYEPIFEIYPNPSSNNLNIDLEFVKSSKIDIMIYDVNGKIIYQLNETSIKSSVFNINLVDFKSGLYYCSVITDYTKLTKLFSVIR